MQKFPPLRCLIYDNYVHYWSSTHNQCSSFEHRSFTARNTPLLDSINQRHRCHMCGLFKVILIHSWLASHEEISILHITSNECASGRISACVYLCLCTCLYICTCVCLYLCMPINWRASIYVPVCMCLFVPAYVCVRLYVFLCILVSVHALSCAHLHLSVSAYTFVCVCANLCICARLHVCTCPHLSVCVSAPVYESLYVRLYVYVCVSAHWCILLRVCTFAASVGLCVSVRKYANGHTKTDGCSKNGHTYVCPCVLAADEFRRVSCLSENWFAANDRILSLCEQITESAQHNIPVEKMALWEEGNLEGLRIQYWNSGSFRFRRTRRWPALRTHSHSKIRLLLMHTFLLLQCLNG